MKKHQKTELTVSRILEAAMSEFGKNGYAGGTINNICKAGINKGLLYHNFSGKDELYLTCLRLSCEKLMEYLREHSGTETPEKYLSARMDFFNEHPEEAHIFFEALLDPPAQLSEETATALSGFNELNEEMYVRTLDGVILRDGISREDALSYFHLMQLMLNGYFSSPAFQYTEPQKKVELHETAVSKLLNCMLYGIAKEKE